MKQHEPCAPSRHTNDLNPKCLPGPHGQAFARVEAIALVLIAFVLIAILLAVAPYERRTAMLNRDLANLRQIGAWTANYANDFEGLHPTFSSAPNSTYPDIRATATGGPLTQAAGHAIDILRRRTGRETFAIPGLWVPHILYNHFVLIDYADRLLPDSVFVSAGDKHRMNWIDDPMNKYYTGSWLPYQPSASLSSRMPYSSSFLTPPAFFDQREANAGIRQSSSHSSYSVIGPIGAHMMSDIVYPAQKTMMHDAGSWYVARTAQYALVESSSTAMVMSDGAAALRKTADANEGWDGNPTSPTPSQFNYSPRLWDPPTSNGQTSEIVVGHYRWTRGRLDGRDFDGPEIDTGQK